MKFGQLLELRRQLGPDEFRPYYLRYDELKQFIRALPRHDNTQEIVSVQTALNRRLMPSNAYDDVAMVNVTEEKFVKTVEEDIERIGRFVTLQSESLHLRLLRLLQLSSDVSEVYTLDYLREEADSIGRMTCEIDRLILINYQGFLKIAKKHDRWIGLTTRPWMLARLSAASFFHERFDKIVSGLSEVYALLNMRALGAGGEGGVWQPPSSFERKTNKYWVKPEDVLWLKCEMVKNIPILIFGRPKPTLGAFSGLPPPPDSSLITSVYLDNSAHDVYHTRMARLDGATLIRIRWYGALKGPNTPVFVERKTHREKPPKVKKAKKANKGAKGDSSGDDASTNNSAGASAASAAGSGAPRIDKPPKAPKSAEEKAKKKAAKAGGKSDKSGGETTDAHDNDDSESETAREDNGGKPEKKSAPPGGPPLQSVKERFKLLYRDIPDLFAGRLDIKARVEGPLRVEGASEADIAYAVNLCTEVQNEMVSRKLLPMMTTIYYRTSFQLHNSNTVRSTLDCQLRMVDENSCRHRVAPGDWYKALDNETNKQIHEFPYAVLEIKLQGEQPDWVSALLDSGRLVKCWKFSKFGHGTAALGFPIQRMPHWFGEERVFLPPEQNASIASVGGSAVTTCRLSPMAPAMLSGSTSTLASLPENDQGRRMSRGGLAPHSQPLPGQQSERGSSNTSEMGGSYAGVQRPGSGTGGVDRRAASFSGDNTPPSVDNTPPNSAKPLLDVRIPIDADSSITSVTTESSSKPASLASSAAPYSLSAKPRPRDESSSEDEALAPPKKQSYFNATARASESGGKDPEKKRQKKEERRKEREEEERRRIEEEILAAKAARKAEKKGERPMRFKIDPKTLFANERTMLQWLNMAVLLVFTSLALLATSTAVQSSSSVNPNVKALAGGVQLCGAILAPAAVLVMIYAMWRYYWRISRITRPDENARFEDTVGPLILVGMIIIVCSVAIFISVNRYNWSHFTNPHGAGDAYDDSSASDAGSATGGGGSVPGVRANTAVVAMSVSNGTAPYGYQPAAEPQFTGRMGMLGGGGFAETGDGTYGTSIEPTILVWGMVFVVACVVMLAIGQCQIIAALWRICGAMRTPAPRGSVQFGSEDEPLMGSGGGFSGLFPGQQPAGSPATTVGEDSGPAHRAPGAAKAPSAPTRQQKWESFVSSILPPSARMRLRRTTVV